jgi:MoaA/NifB/PqqE/SkfB family radical SAM enzyme
MSGLTRLVSRTWKKNILFSVLLELTYRCNLHCHFCYNDLGQTGTPLENEQYFRLLEDLSAMQVMNLILSGGEPLAHPGFFAIGSRGRELGFLVRIKSNGHALRGRLALRLKDEVDPFVVDLSLHGSTAATHDRQTRLEGSFERLMSNLDELQELGLRLKLNCTLTRWNEHEIEQMLDLAEAREIPLSINPTVAPRDNGDQEPLLIAPSREARVRLYRLLDERAKRATPGPTVQVQRPADDAVPTLEVEKNCGAGSSHATIDPYGNVLPCVQWRRPVGNLHQASIQEIWGQSRELEGVRGLSIEAKRMVDSHGPAGRLMDFCPGLAQVTTGSPIATYDSATEQMETLLQVNAESRRKERLPIVS